MILVSFTRAVGVPNTRNTRKNTKHESFIYQHAICTNADHVTPHEQGEMLSRHQAMFHASMHMFRRAGNAGRIIVRGKRKKNFAMP